MAEILQKGNSPTVPVTRKETLGFYGKMLSGGAAGAAAKEVESRPSRVDAAEKKAVGYKAGGLVKNTKGSTKRKWG